MLFCASTGEPFSMELEKDKREELSSSNEISKAKIENTRQKFGLTEEQMEKVLHSSFQQVEDDLDWTLTQKLNLLVYGSFILGMAYVLNRDYDSLATQWFVRMFPREAKTLGLYV